MRKTIATLVAALGLLVAATGASAAIPVDTGLIYGKTTPSHSFQLAATRTTTAYAIGVWTSSWTSITTKLPITYSGYVDCIHNANDHSFGGTLFANRYVSDATYLWFGSRATAGPWFGWDTCSIAVNFYAQNLGNDDSLYAWLVSHE